MMVLQSSHGGTCRVDPDLLSVGVINMLDASRKEESRASFGSHVDWKHLPATTRGDPGMSRISMSAVSSTFVFMQDT